MEREPDIQSVDILYIGRFDPTYDKVWQQLQRDGHVVVFARTQIIGLQLAKELQPRIVVVNIADGHFSGDRLCRKLGRCLPGAVRLLIAQRGAGENVPCDQRLVPPFTVRRLRESLIKLLETAGPHVLEAGPVRLDLVSRTVIGPKGRHHLTPKQSSLLAAFMRRPNQVISRKDLMRVIWHTGYLGDTRTLDVHIRWIREKIEVDPLRPTLILTRRGVGYMLAVGGQEPPADNLPDED
jgi:two-component system phosphate regulon response regulator PhoB